LISIPRNVCASWQRFPQTLIALALFVLTLALRLPFASQTLNHWDSVNHALALTAFNVAAHRPQPPGYILYIGIARLVNFIFPDAQTALVVVTMLASALAVAFLFLLGARMVSREMGLIAALLLLTSPPFWFDGEVALPYTVEGSASIVLAFLLHKMLTGEQRIASLTAVVFAISIGLRQQMALFFAPLVLYVFWKQSWRARVESVAWFAFVCALWFVPLMVSAGGIENYLKTLRELNSSFASEYVLGGAGGEAGLVRNIVRQATYTAYALNLALLPFVFALASRWRESNWRGVWENPRARFLALWIVPSILFYTLFHMGSPGLIYVYLPALFLIAAWGVMQLTRAVPQWRVFVVIALCAANAFLFLGTPPDLYTGRALRALNYSSLVAHDRSLGARVETIRAQFDPRTTLVLATDWRFAEYYLPEYRAMLFLPQDRVPLLVIQNQRENYVQLDDPRAQVQDVKTIVLFDAGAAKFYHGASTLACLTLADRSCLQNARMDAPIRLRKDGVWMDVP